MKLELKHLAGYLPYGLKVLSGKKTVRELDTEWKDTTLSKQFTGCYNVLQGIGHKPILRPMSDLLKENGKLMIGLLETIEPYLFANNNKYRWKVDIDSMGSISVKSKTNYNSFMFDTLDCELMKYDDDEPQSINDRYKIYDKLNELHIDWKHNLIENGLAIDINTIT